MIEKKDLISDRTLMNDIKNLPEGYNSGRSKAIASVFKLNDSERRLRHQWKTHGKKRREAKRTLSPKAIANGSRNGIHRKNSILKNELDAVKSRLTEKYPKTIGYLK